MRNISRKIKLLQFCHLQQHNFLEDHDTHVIVVMALQACHFHKTLSQSDKISSQRAADKMRHALRTNTNNRNSRVPRNVTCGADVEQGSV